MRESSPAATVPASVPTSRVAELPVQDYPGPLRYRLNQKDFVLAADSVYRPFPVSVASAGSITSCTLEVWINVSTSVRMISLMMESDCPGGSVAGYAVSNERPIDQSRLSERLPRIIPCN